MYFPFVFMSWGGGGMGDISLDLVKSLKLELFKTGKVNHPSPEEWRRNSLTKRQGAQGLMATCRLLYGDCQDRGVSEAHAFGRLL